MLLCFLPQFLLTPLREGRRGHGGHDINGAAYFYSRPCGRGDVDRLAEVVHEPNFYSRPCGRGDEAARRRINERIEFLLTPLREGRREAAIKNRNIGYISTHAPAGGATGRGRPAAQGYQHISTHAPAGGATCQVSAASWPEYFYSRPCGRGDKATTQETHLAEIISTHAPAGGATRRGAAVRRI